MKRLDVIQNTCLRIIVGAMKSTRIDSLCVETYILPLSHRRELLTGQYYYNICHKPKSHPVVLKILDSLHSYESIHFRLPRLQPFLLRARSILLALGLPVEHHNHRPLVGPVPPWSDMLPTVDLDLIFPIRKTSPRALQRDAFLSTLDVRYSTSIGIYTDGSLITHQDGNKVSAAFCVPHLSIAKSFRLPATCSICSAELYAILRALQYIHDNLCHLFALPSTFSGLVVCSDSKSALQIVQNGTLDDCGFVHAIYETLYSIQAATNVLASFQWVPSHCDVSGNELADGLAVAAHLNLDQPIIEVPPCLSNLKKELSNSINDKYNLRWRVTSAATHLGLIKDRFVSWHHIFVHDRRSDVVISRLRLGHTCLKGHLYKIGLADSPNCTNCSVIETPQHLLLDCPLYAQARTTLLSSLSTLKITTLSLRSLLGGGKYTSAETLHIFHSLCIFLKQIDRFHDL